MFSANETIKNFNWLKFSLFSFFVIALQLVRLLLRHYYDETDLYSSYVSVSQAFLGVWILISVILLFDNVNIPQKLKRAINYFDGLSFYIYIVHGCFFRGTLNAYELSDNYIVQSIIFFTCSFISAIILKFVSEKLKVKILKK